MLLDAITPYRMWQILDNMKSLIRKSLLSLGKLLWPFCLHIILF